MKTKARNYTLIFGSNTIQNCDGIIDLVGKGVNKQPIVFKEGGYGKILLNCTIKDYDGNTVVKIHSSEPLYVNDNYDSKIENKRILVTEKSTGDIWLDFTEIEPKTFKINGIFIFPDIEVIATDEYLKFNGNTISNSVFMNCGSILGIE